MSLNPKSFFTTSKTTYYTYKSDHEISTLKLFEYLKKLEVKPDKILILVMLAMQPAMRIVLSNHHKAI